MQDSSDSNPTAPVARKKDAGGDHETGSRLRRIISSQSRDQESPRSTTRHKSAPSRGERCTAAKKNRQARLDKLGTKADFDTHSRLNRMVYDACK
jgi:hypothetical protein